MNKLDKLGTVILIMLSVVMGTYLVNTERIRSLHEDTHFVLRIEPRKDLGADVYDIVWSWDFGSLSAINKAGAGAGFFMPLNIDKTYVNRFTNDAPVTIKYRIDYYRNTTVGGSWYWERFHSSEWLSEKFFPVRKSQ